MRGIVQVAAHNDIADPAQTVDVLNPAIRTTALDERDDNGEVFAGGRLIDRGTYPNVPAGTYTATVTWMDAETSEPSGLTAVTVGRDAGPGVQVRVLPSPPTTTSDIASPAGMSRPDATQWPARVGQW